MSRCKAIINAILTPIMQLKHVAAAKPRNPKRSSHLANSGLKQNEAPQSQTNSQACFHDDDARTCRKMAAAMLSRPRSRWQFDV